MTSSQRTTAISAGRKPRDDEIDAYGLSHTGKVRENNQDHFLIASLRKQMQVHLTSLPSSDQVSGTERLAFLAMVADGVGGGPKGEEASRLAAAAVTRYVTESMQCYYGADPREEESFPTVLEEAALQCHMDLTRRSRGDAEHSGMATTLTLWLGV
ncbi:MAG: PP2C family protein-serine/threonine phosphatase, partial [Candidatus Methylomirabilaceae bacterium]